MKAFVLVGVGLSAYLSVSGQPAGRSLNISTEPKASVVIDGVSYGRTGTDGSLAIRSLSAGAHTLRVRADGFKEKTLPLTALQKGELKVPLAATTDEAELAFQEAERFTSADRDKAVEAYRRAIKLRPGYAEAYVAMARVLTDQGELDAAQAAIVGARKMKPGFAEASVVQARIFKENSEEAKAIAAYKRAITENKGFQPEAYAGLGILYKEKAETFGGSGDFDNEKINYDLAVENLSKSLKQLGTAPDAIVIYQLLGLSYERSKKIKEAIALYEEFLRIFPDVPEADAVKSFIVQLKKANPDM